MLHVEKKVKKEESKKVEETKVVKKEIVDVQKKEPVIKVETSKKSTTKKEPEVADKYNGLHAYALVVRGKFHAVTDTKNAIVTARTEETAKNRVKKEYPEMVILSIKRIPDEDGHKILKRVRNKAGIFFDEKGSTLIKK